METDLNLWERRRMRKQLLNFFTCGVCEYRRSQGLAWCDSHLYSLVRLQQLRREAVEGSSSVEEEVSDMDEDL